MSGILTASSPFLAFSSSSPSPRRTTTVSVRAAASAVAEPRTRMNSSSLYEVLRVQRTATPTEIKKAYRTLAKKYHPDCAGGGSDLDFIDIHNAYQTLLNPTARSVYDMSLLGGARRGNGSSAVKSSPYGYRRWETDQCW